MPATPEVYSIDLKGMETVQSWASRILHDRPPRQKTFDFMSIDMEVFKEVSKEMALYYSKSFVDMLKTQTPFMRAAK